MEVLIKIKKCVNCVELWDENVELHLRFMDLGHFHLSWTFQNLQYLYKRTYVSLILDGEKNLISFRLHVKILLL